MADHHHGATRHAVVRMSLILRSFPPPGYMQVLYAKRCSTPCCAAREASSMQRSAFHQTIRSHPRHAGSHQRCGTPTVCPMLANPRSLLEAALLCTGSQGLKLCLCVALQCMQMAGFASPSYTALAMTRMGMRRRLSAGLPCTRCALKTSKCTS